MDHESLKELATAANTKTVLFVLDGIAGIPHPKHENQTELDAAKRPNLDRLAQEGVCGIHDPVAPGIAPGSGPGHFALFGYDPLTTTVGRGVQEALGVGVDIGTNDLAIRGNLCAVKENDDRLEVITHRRAYRPPTSQCEKLCSILRDRVRVPGVKVRVEALKEHRFLLVLSGLDLSSEVSETDPQAVGVPVREAEPLSPTGVFTAQAINEFAHGARQALEGETVIRSGGEGPDEEEHYHVLLRGYGTHPDIISLKDTYGIRCAAIATYPMYRGISRLIGMDILEVPEPQTLKEEIEVLRKHWADYDFFFLHFKPTDKAGEDSDFPAKVKAIQEADSFVPEILRLEPDVLVVTGDHATPSLLGRHSWHPVPVIIHGKYAGAGGATAFTERACAQGGLGRLPAVHIMPQAMACALRLTKYGA